MSLRNTSASYKAQDGNYSISCNKTRSQSEPFIKTDVCRGVFRTLPNIYDEAF